MSTCLEGEGNIEAVEMALAEAIFSDWEWKKKKKMGFR